MIMRLFTVAAVGALLVAAFDPVAADSSRVTPIGFGTGIAAFGLMAALLGTHAPLFVYPAPPVVYMPPPDGAVPARANAHVPSDDSR